MANDDRGGLFRRRAQAREFSARRPITASAARINIKNRDTANEVRNAASGREWHPGAWYAYDKIGEIKFAFTLTSAVASRLRLYAGVIIDDAQAPVPLTDGVFIERPEGEEDDSEAGRRAPSDGISADLALAARDAMGDILGGSSVPNLIRSYSLNMSVPGECYLVYENGKMTCRSVDELIINGSDKIQVRTITGMPRDLKDNATVGRVWRNHPRYSFESDSSMKAIIDDCEELILLSQAIRAISRSKANGGMIFIPDTVEVLSQAPTDDAEEEAAQQDTFVSEMIYAYMDPLVNDKSMAAVMPTILRGPREDADAIKYIATDRKIDEFMVQRGKDTLDRVMMGLDVPKDLITGYANVKYSNAIAIDQSLYKAHIEPLALTLCDAITEIYLQPLLRAKGFTDEEVEKVVVWYDPSEVVVRPDRADDAEKLYDKYELSGAALRSAAGFAETDAPTEGELARRLAMASTLPAEVVSALIKIVLPKALGNNTEDAPPGELPDSLNQALKGSDGTDDDPTAVPADLN